MVPIYKGRLESCSQALDQLEKLGADKHSSFLCLSATRFFWLIYCLRSKYMWSNVWCSFIRVDSSLVRRHQTNQKKLAADKHSSFLYLSATRFFWLVYCLRSRYGWSSLWCPSLRVALSLARKHQTNQKKLAADKHSSFLCSSIGDAE